MSRARIASLAAKVGALRRSMPSLAWFLRRERGETRDAWERRVATARAEADAASATGRTTAMFTIDFQEDES